MAPHQKVTFPRPRAALTTPLAPGVTVSTHADPQVVVEWDRLGWVDIALYPQGWGSTSDATRATLNPQDLDLLIKTLKRARRQAYGDGARYVGYEDGPARKPEDLWPDVAAEMDDNVVDGLYASPHEGDVAPLPGDPVEVVDRRDPWAHDLDFGIRQTLQSVFGIEVGEGVEPMEVASALMSRHNLSHEQALRVVNPLRD